MAQIPEILYVAKLLKQGYRYNKLRKTFSKFYRWHFDSVSKYNIGLKTFLLQAFRKLNFLATLCINLERKNAGPRSAVDRVPDSYLRCPGFDTQSGHIPSFLLQLIPDEQLSVTGESMCTKYWLTASEV